MIPYKAPGFQIKAFNCPHCNAYANQIWYSFRYFSPRSSTVDMPELLRATCVHCGKFTLWLDGKMIYPENTGVPLPNADLNADLKEDYTEARNIVTKSPRGAAALLRLCIQKLCRQLGEKGSNINDDIANLVKKGLAKEIQQSLDIVRVVGNNAVHPGQIDLRDDIDLAMNLFELINIIADVMITQKKEITRLYESLPKSQQDAIEERDGK